MKRKRNACLAILEQMRGIAADVSLTDTICFLYICENQGINVSELAQLSGLTQSSASRAARRLATANTVAALPPALGLVELRRQETDGRGRVLSLTPAGERLRETVEALIAAADPIQALPRRPI